MPTFFIRSSTLVGGKKNADCYRHAFPVRQPVFSPRRRFAPVNLSRLRENLRTADVAFPCGPRRQNQRTES